MDSTHGSNLLIPMDFIFKEHNTNYVLAADITTLGFDWFFFHTGHVILVTMTMVLNEDTKGMFDLHPLADFLQFLFAISFPGLYSWDMMSENHISYLNHYHLDTNIEKSEIGNIITPMVIL